MAPQIWPECSSGRPQGSVRMLRCGAGRKSHLLLVAVEFPDPLAAFEFAIFYLSSIPVKAA